MPPIRLLAALLLASLASLAQTTAPAPTGSVTGRILDKQGQFAINARVRAQDPNAVGSTVGFAGNTTPGGETPPAVATEDRGHFTLRNLPPGKINLIVTLTLPDGTRQRGQTTTEVLAGAVTRLSEDIRLADAPAPAASPTGSASPNPEDRIRTSRGTRGINP